MVYRLAILASTGLVLASCSLVQKEEGLRAWTLPSSHSEALTEHHKLIGFACGPQRLTMTAAEEDHFPASGCEAIEAIADVCPTDPPPSQFSDEPVTAAECARYWGDGW